MSHDVEFWHTGRMREPIGSVPYCAAHDAWHIDPCQVYEAGRNAGIGRLHDEIFTLSARVEQREAELRDLKDRIAGYTGMELD
jgi:hypothetical protein